jgi:hypothetical protein
MVGLSSPYSKGTECAIAATVGGILAYIGTNCSFCKPNESDVSKCGWSGWTQDHQNPIPCLSGLRCL